MPVDASPVKHSDLILVIMKGFVTLRSWAEFRLQRYSNPGPRDPELEVLTTRPHGRFSQETIPGKVRGYIYWKEKETQGKFYS